MSSHATTLVFLFDPLDRFIGRYVYTIQVLLSHPPGDIVSCPSCVPVTRVRGWTVVVEHSTLPSLTRQPVVGVFVCSVSPDVDRGNAPIPVFLRTSEHRRVHTCSIERTGANRCSLASSPATSHDFKQSIYLGVVYEHHSARNGPCALAPSSVSEIIHRVFLCSSSRERESHGTYVPVVLWSVSLLSACSFVVRP